MNNRILAWPPPRCLALVKLFSFLCLGFPICKMGVMGFVLHGPALRMVGDQDLG